MNSSTTSTNREEKLSDGIYITRISQSKSEADQNSKQASDSQREKYIESGDKMRNSPKQTKYVYRSTAELIALLENDFEQIFLEIHMLYKANEEMLEYDANDYDLIQAREENLEIINKMLNSLMEIQSQLRTYCPTNPLALKNIFDFFKEIPLTSTYPEEIEINSNIETTSNITINQFGNTIHNKNRDDLEIITDIEL